MVTMFITENSKLVKMILKWELLTVEITTNIICDIDDDVSILKSQDTKDNRINA